jgi:hypothetical protein
MIHRNNMMGLIGELGNGGLGPTAPQPARQAGR